MIYSRMLGGLSGQSLTQTVCRGCFTLWDVVGETNDRLQMFAIWKS